MDSVFGDAANTAAADRKRLDRIYKQIGLDTYLSQERESGYGEKEEKEDSSIEKQ